MSEIQLIQRILTQSQTIAIVGLSPKPQRPSHGVAKYLIKAGYQVIPINPGHAQILGQQAYPDLASVPVAIDIVDVFRRAEHTPAIAREAVAVGAECLWLQLGISNEEAKAIATQGGLEVIMDRCTKIEHAKLGL